MAYAEIRRIAAGGGRDQLILAVAWGKDDAIDRDVRPLLVYPVLGGGVLPVGHALVPGGPEEELHRLLRRCAGRALVVVGCNIGFQLAQRWAAPLNEAYAARAAVGTLRSYENFDYAINGVVV